MQSDVSVRPAAEHRAPSRPRAPRPFDLIELSLYLSDPLELNFELPMKIGEHRTVLVQKIDNLIELSPRHVNPSGWPSLLNGAGRGTPSRGHSVDPNTTAEVITAQRNRLSRSTCCLETDKRPAYRVEREFYVNLSSRMAAITANLDDLQSGIEACSRAADALQIDTTKFNGLLNAPLLRALVRHVKELQACARDQRAAMQELRDSIKRLQQELKRSNSAVRPPPLANTERRGQ